MLESLIARYGYAAIFAGTLLEGETVLVLGGFAAHRGLLELPGVILAAFAGSLASAQLSFFLGRRHGARWLARRPGWAPAVARVRRLLDRHATPIIVGFRFLYGLRSVTPFALGMSSVPTARFVLLDALGAAVWAVAVAALGWAVGQAAERRSATWSATNGRSRSASSAPVSRSGWRMPCGRAGTRRGCGRRRRGRLVPGPDPASRARGRP